MSITYRDKTKLIRRLSTLGEWENLFPAEWLMDEKRRWQIINIEGKGFSAQTDESGNSVHVTHKQSGATLTLTRVGKKTIICDESGSVVTADADKLEMHSGRPANFLSPKKSIHENGFDPERYDEARISQVGCIIGFDKKTGEKTVVLDNHSGVIAVFPQGLEECLKNDSDHRTRFFHTVAFDEAALGRRRASNDVQNGVILVTAFDLALEPELVALNILSPDAINLYDEKLRAALQAREDDGDSFGLTNDWRGGSLEVGVPDVPRLKDVEVPWVDTVDFKGKVLGTPRLFFVRKEDEGFTISTTIDQKDQIISAGTMLRAALAEDPVGVTYKADRGQVGNALSLLQVGHKVRNHRDEEWAYTVIKSANAGSTARHLRMVMQGNLGLSGVECSAISFGKDLTVVGMSQDSLQRSSRALRATGKVMKAIETGKYDGDPEEFLRRQFEAGADLRYVDPEAASKGQSFATLMKEREQWEALAATRDVTGVAAELDMN